MLPADSFTHVSEAWGSVSWLDHIVSSSDFHNCIKTVSIDHDLSDADHIPVRMDISLDDIPGTSSCDEGSYRRICWDKLNADGRAKCRDVSHELLSQLIVPDAVNCTDHYHITDTDSFYNEIMQCLIQASDTAFSKHNPIKGSVKPGWSDYVAELHSTSRDVAKLWGNACKPRQGYLFELLYNTLFSREEIFAKSEFEIFSREYIFANILFTRKYLPAKISSRENFFPRKFLLAKISSRENIFPRIVSVPPICKLVGLGYEVYYSIT